MAEASSGKRTTQPTPRARTQRGKSRKDVEKTHHVLDGVIKCSLHRFLPNEHPLRAHIHATVESVSLLTHYVSYMIHGFTLWAFENRRPFLPNFQRNSLFNFLSIIVGRGEAKSEHQTSFAEYYDIHWKTNDRWIEVRQFIQSRTNAFIQRAALSKLSVVLRNSVFMTLEGRIRGFLKLNLPKPSKDGVGFKQLAKLCMNIPVAAGKPPGENAAEEAWQEYRKASLNFINDRLTPEQRRLVLHIRTNLGIDEGVEADQEWIEEHEVQVLHFVWSHILRPQSFLRKDDGEPCAMFKLLPLFHYKRIHMTIDTDILKKLLKDCKMLPRGPITNDEAGQRLLWSLVLPELELNRLIGKSKNFQYSVATDGIALSCNFWKRGQLKQPALPKRRRVEPAPVNMATHNTIIVGKGQVFWNAAEVPLVLGCDPGRSDLLHLCNDDQQSLTRLTKNELYARSGFNKATRQRESTKSAGAIEIETKQPSWKVATTDLFHQALDYKLTHDRVLWEFYMPLSHNVERFRAFRAKTQVVDRFIARHVLAPPLTLGASETENQKNRIRRLQKDNLRFQRPPPKKKDHTVGEKLGKARRRKNRRLRQKAHKARVVVALGSAVFPTSAKGQRAGPGASLRVKLGLQTRVLLTSEYRTSKMCSNDGEELKDKVIRNTYMSQETGKPITAKEARAYHNASRVHRMRMRMERIAVQGKPLERLESYAEQRPPSALTPARLVHAEASTWSVRCCPTCRTFWSRDLNASINIRRNAMERLLEHQEGQ